MYISIKGLDKAAVLAALFNAATAHGDPMPMHLEEAGALLAKDTYFTVIRGRDIYVNLVEDEFDPWCYDLKNGKGSAEAAVSGLKESCDHHAPSSKPNIATAA